MTKKEVREKYKSMRKQLSIDEVEKLSREIADQSLQLPIWRNQNFHIFLPIIEKKEVDTKFLLDILKVKNKTLFVSRSNFENGAMSHYLLDNDTIIVKNKYGIPEPEGGNEVSSKDLDVIFVPLLAFDMYGHRVGYGKGFYDRFLIDCRKDAIKVGLSFFDAEESWDDVFESDVKLDFCVTPRGIIKFSQELLQY